MCNITVTLRLDVNVSVSNECELFIRWIVSGEMEVMYASLNAVQIDPEGRKQDVSGEDEEDVTYRPEKYGIQSS